LIRLDRVSLSIDQSRILHDIDLTLRDGEWIALTGRNGSGKSMLLRLMAGLIEPSSGRVTVDGMHPLSEAAGGGPHGSGNAGAPFDLPGGTHGDSESAGGLPAGIAFQNPDSQFITSSVAREVRFGMENIGIGSEEIESRFREAIERFALEAFLDRNPHMLSGGEKQRLLLASIWSMRPRHFLLDEPFSFLDEEARRSALETVRRTFHDKGRTVVWATLDPEELSLADRVICIDGGCIVYDGLPEGAEAALPEGVLAGDMPVRRARPSDASAEGTAAAVAVDTPETGEQMRGPNESRGAHTILRMDRALLAPVGGGFTLGIPELFLRAGETLGVTGPSGSGKTTLLLGCSGLLPPREGSLTLFGERIRSRKDFPAGSVAFLFQSPEDGFFAPTVGEEVALANRRFGSGRADEEAAREALERVGLDPDIFMERSPFHLSQGEKRLVALASQLALPARLFLMDEPTLFLDGMARARLAAALDRLAAEGATIVIASHDTRFIQSRTERQVRLPLARLGA
jgi:energy-coupling factor transporter ATP-binding protein EcfA2